MDSVAENLTKIGYAEGYAKGYAKGYDRGYARGYARGKARGKAIIVYKHISKGYVKLSEGAEELGISVRKLKADMKKAGYTIPEK